MEVLTNDGSNDGLKEAEKPTLKMNGDMNGSMEGMEVDEDSRESAGGASDDSAADQADQAADGSEAEISDGDHKEAAEGKSNLGSDVDARSEIDGKSHFGSECDGKSVSQMESMDVDAIGDGEGESVNSEDEDNLLNSDNEQTDPTREKVDHNDGESDEEERDINDTADLEDHDKSMDKDTDNDDEEDKAEELDDEEMEKKKDDEGHDGDDDGTDSGEDAKDTADSQNITPTKKKKLPDVTITPRRSSRTVQKPVRFGQELADGSDDDSTNESDAIEEIAPTDPLADPLTDKENRRFPRIIGNTTIVVSDAKRLSDMATQRNAAIQQKKEPTLVIIDTNSILAGRGGVPMQTQGGVTITQTSSQKAYVSPQPNYPPKPKPPQILPSLTDDMYVVEAPSFIVPYVYEKPPVKKFKKYLKKMLKQVRKQEEERIAREEKEDAEEEQKKLEAGKDETEKKDEVGEKVEDKAENDKSAEPVKEEEKMDVDETPKEVKKEGDEAKIDDDVEEVESTKQDAVDSHKKKEEEGEKKETVKKLESPKEAEESTDTDSDENEEEEEKKKAPGTGSYFANPLGKFFMQIGMNLVQEFVQTDLLKQQKKKQKLGKGNEETQAAIASLKKNLILSKENNEPYTMEQVKCEFCSFKTESKLIMAHHLETPHMRNYVYRCNFCPLEVRGPHDILLHMEAEHCVRGRLERAPAFHQCPQCPFEDNQKGKLTRHMLTCAKKFRPEKNLEPPLDWEPPAKIPRVPRKPSSMPLNVSNPMYAQSAAAKNIPHQMMPKMGPGMPTTPTSMLRTRGRPPYPLIAPGNQKMMPRGAGLPPQLTRANMMYRPPSNNSPVVLPAPYQISGGNQLYQVVGPQGQMMNIPGGPPALQRLGVPSQPQQQKNPATAKLLNQPSISITPLPRQAPSTPQAGAPAARQATPGTSKTTFVICEICDGYIKDLEQLRNHMQWIHKVKIHPKMIYNRPPLNCQKCQFRFFTDQGLERHLLGSHGLVTSSMQDSANKGKDGGRCPVCGRVYQWKLLNHVARDHNMTLKPAHLSYKCTVCTATFGMYKQFESHVYSAHSIVAKRVMDKKNGQAPPPAPTPRTDTASLLKPLKINDEITIIPQPAKKAAAPAQQSQQQAQRPVPGNIRANITPKGKISDSVQVIDLEDSPNKASENGSESLTAVKERLRRRKSLEIRQLESEGEGDSGSEEGDTSQNTKANEGEDDDEEDDGQETDEPESDA